MGRAFSFWAFIMSKKLKKYVFVFRLQIIKFDIFFKSNLLLLMWWHSLYLKKTKLQCAATNEGLYLSRWCLQSLLKSNENTNICDISKRLWPHSAIASPKLFNIVKVYCFPFRHVIIMLHVRLAKPSIGFSWFYRIAINSPPSTTSLYQSYSTCVVLSC